MLAPRPGRPSRFCVRGPYPRESAHRQSHPSTTRGHPRVVGRAATATARPAVRPGHHRHPVERAIRPIALGRKNWLFAGSDAGGTRAAAIASLIPAARLEGLDPEAYLRQRGAIHPARPIAELLPWNCASLIATAQDIRRAA